MVWVPYFYSIICFLFIFLWEVISVLCSQFLSVEIYCFSAHYPFLIVSESMGGSILCFKRARQYGTKFTVLIGSDKGWAGLVELCSNQNISDGLFFCSEVVCCSSEISFPYQFDNILRRETKQISTMFWCFFCLYWSDFHFTLLLQITTLYKIRKK